MAQVSTRSIGSVAPQVEEHDLDLHAPRETKRISEARNHAGRKLLSGRESARAATTPAAIHRIGQILISEGVIDAVTEKKAADIQARSPDRKFGEILVQDLGVNHHAVFSRLARIYAFKTLNLDPAKIEEKDVEFVRDALRDLPDETRTEALKRQILPLRQLDRRQDTLVVVTPDPTDREVLGIANQFGYRRTEICYGPLSQIEEIIARVGPVRNEYLENVEASGLPVDLDENESEGLDEAALDVEINQSMLTNLLEGCLVEAVRQGASDIHIVPQDGNQTHFYLRTDGKLHLWYTQEGTKPEAVVAVVKDRSRGIDRFERNMAQDGFMQREIDGHLIRYRVSILPLAGNQPQRKLEDIVIRVLDDRKVISDLGRLGLQAPALKALKTALSRPQGMVILTGPTGSGKSTTLNAALHHVMDPSLCVLTVEDPVEYVIPGARQIKIGEHFRFEDAVRTILRHDPDIVMVGEIRDRETAEAAIKLANTGHLTFSTLHTNDAPSVVSRLYKMNVEPFLIASAVNIVVAQRLVATLCPACKKQIQIDQTRLKVCLQAGLTEDQMSEATICRAVGCSVCNGTGYKGRMGIQEALLFSKEIRQLIIESGERIDESAVRETAMAQGMATLRQAGLAQVAAGETSLQAVLEATATDL
jgi:type IV pilus assembly protein PilB